MLCLIFCKQPAKIVSYYVKHAKCIVSVRNNVKSAMAQAATQSGPHAARLNT